MGRRVERDTGARRKWKGIEFRVCMQKSPCHVCPLRERLFDATIIVSAARENADTTYLTVVNEKLSPVASLRNDGSPRVVAIQSSVTNAPVTIDRHLTIPPHSFRTCACEGPRARSCVLFACCSREKCVLRQLRACIIEEFSLKLFVRRSATLRILSRESDLLPCIIHRHSPMFTSEFSERVATSAGVMRIRKTRENFFMNFPATSHQTPAQRSLVNADVRRSVRSGEDTPGTVRFSGFSLFTVSRRAETGKSRRVDDRTPRKHDIKAVLAQPFCLSLFLAIESRGRGSSQ